jgi:hypothetical protein
MPFGHQLMIIVGFPVTERPRSMGRFRNRMHSELL